MAKFLIILILLPIVLFAQDTNIGFSYYHDPALDGINSGVSGVNASMTAYGKWVTTNDLNALNQSYYNNQMPETNIIATNAQANAILLANTYSNLFHDNPMALAAALTNISSGTNVGQPSSNSVIDLGYFNGQSYSLDISFQDTLPFLQNIAPVVRGCIISATYLLVWLWSMQTLQKNLKETMAQRQIQGNTQSIMGVNLALIVGGVAIVAITAAFYLAMHAIANNGSIGIWFRGSSALFTYLANAPTNVPGYDTLTAFFPVSEMVVIFCGYYAFEYVLCFPAFLIVKGLIWFFVA